MTADNPPPLGDLALGLVMLVIVVYAGLVVFGALR